MYFDRPDPFREIRFQILLTYGFSPQRAGQMLDDPMLSSNRWTPLRYQFAQMIDQAKDGDRQAQEELKYYGMLFPGVPQLRETKKPEPKATVMKPVAPGHVLDIKRVGAQSRMRTLERLQQAYAEEILGDEDFTARQAAAMKAQTQPELDALVTDLPEETPVARPVPVAEAAVLDRWERVGAVFGWANAMIWPALGAYTVLLVAGLPLLAAMIIAAVFGNLLTTARVVVDRRRSAG